MRKYVVILIILTVLPGLLFADDLVLVAKSERELKEQIWRTQLFLGQRKLSINYSKTEIIRIGAGAEELKTWVLPDIEGTETQEIIETETYRYLGAKLGRLDRVMKKKEEEKLNMSRKLALLKQTAKDTPDCILAADTVWNHAVKPALIYAAETTHCMPWWVQALEILQGKVGRWALDCSWLTSKLGIRGEMGWPTIQGQIWKDKLAYTARIRGMGPERWPKRVLEDMEQEKYGMKWQEEVKKGLEEFQVTENEILGKAGKKVIKRKWWEYEERIWRDGVSEKQNLSLYPEGQLQGMASHLTADPSAKIFTRVRVGDVMIWERQQGLPCPCCGKAFNEGVRHIMVNCEKTRESREKTGVTEYIRREKEKGGNLTETLRLMLEDWRTWGKKVCKIYREWEKHKPEDKKENGPSRWR